MELTKDNIIQKNVRKHLHCARNTFFHMNMNLLVLLVEITLNNRKMNLHKYDEKN